MGFIDEDYVEETPFGWDDMPEIDQENITTKTKAIWYPAREKKEANILKWVEDGSV